MVTLASALQDLGFLLYGGPMVAFTVLVAVAYRLPNLRPWDVVRVYRAWGAGFGLSLGATVLGGLVRYYLEHGSFTWPTDTPEQQATLATFLCFLAMWASNVKLEIWTLEPLRKLDKGGDPDAEAWRAPHARLARHMVVHSALVLGAAVLAVISGIA